MLLYRDQHLAAHMAAFLLRCELVLEMDARRAGLDIAAGQLEGVQRAAEAGLGIGDDRGEPVDVAFAFKFLDLIAALQRAVDPACQFGAGIGRIERLVGIHAAGGVGIGRDLPAGQVDRLQSGAHHLHGLVAGHGAEGMNVVLGVKQVPQLVGAVAGQRVFDRHRSGEALHIRHAVIALDPVKAALGSAGMGFELLGHDVVLVFG